MAADVSKGGLVREVNFGDAPEATRLLRSLGLAMPVTPEDIDSHWRRLWIDNPAIMSSEKELSLGWALEKDGRMVGFFCNLPLLYYYGERKLIAADASQWGLEKHHRAKILQLADAYFNQNGADILMATTANVAAGRIFERYGAARIPQPDYDRALYWVTNSKGFLRTGLRKKGLNMPTAKILARGGAPLLDTWISIAKRSPSSGGGCIDLIDVEDIDTEFDDLWLRKRGESNKLLAARSAECIRWQLGAPHISDRTKILVNRQGGRLRGYAALINDEVPDIGLKRLKIVDLFVEKDDQIIVDSLLFEAFRLAREGRQDILELMGLPRNLRHMAQRHRPFVRQLPTWPLFYDAVEKDLVEPLKHQDAWYISSYDGDTILV